MLAWLEKKGSLLNRYYVLCIGAKDEVDAPVLIPLMIINMSGMFDQCGELAGLDVSQFETLDAWLRRRRER